MIDKTTNIILKSFQNIVWIKLLFEIVFGFAFCSCCKIYQMLKNFSKNINEISSLLTGVSYPIDKFD